MLDAEQFLDRVIAPGNFIALAFKGSRGLWHRFYPRDRVGEAAGFMRWATQQGLDCWHAVASYQAAELKTEGRKQHYVGPRTQENAEALRCFWYDADVKREGDNKDPANVYPDLNAAIGALKPLKAAGFPLPNLWVRSGYGVHFYWIIEEALPRGIWTPYAEAFKKLLVAHGLKGDVGLTSDSARILRPVGTFNFKDPANPAPCYDMTPAQITQPWYPNSQVLTHLQPTTGSGLSGTAPAVPINQSLLANAKAGMHREARPHSFARIAQHCAQAQLSLAQGGAGDGRELWHAMVGLTYFCGDQAAAHAVGEKHPDYTPAGTEAEWNRTDDEHRRKPFGAVLCTTLDTLRSNVCGTCPYHGKIPSPFSLGVEPDQPEPDELPRHYRRHNGWIEYERGVAGKKGEYEWARLIEGNITKVGISPSPDITWMFRFSYTGPNWLDGSYHTRALQVDEVDVVPDARGLKATFARLGITLNFSNALPFGQLVMAWIEKLRHGAPQEPLPAIGWAKHDGNYIGFSIGGIYYRADGSEQQVASSGEELRDRVPRGKLSAWQQAAALAGGGHPVTEIAIAIGFAAPLLEFTGEPGLCVAINGKSATGKTSAFMAGTAIWSRPRPTMFSLDDTDNYVNIKIGQLHKNLPAYWDENAITKERAAKIVTFVHKITQGRDKGRAMADTSTRHSGEWNTLVAMSSNRSILDLVASDSNETDAAMLRVFEITIDRVMTPNINAAPIIQKLNDNYGTAGAVYAKYIAANVALIRASLMKVKSWIATNTGGMRNEERFYIAGMCSIIVGAAIVNKIGLLKLDVPAIRDELMATLLRLRAERQKDIPLHDDRTMAIETINAFINAHMPDGVITKYLKPRGQGTLERGFELSSTIANHKTSTPAFQIALKEEVLRINRDHWRDWCATTKRASRALTKMFASELGALIQERGAIGAGTTFSTPHVYYIEVSLAIPDLAHWVAHYLPIAAATSAGANVTPLRPVR